MATPAELIQLRSDYRQLVASAVGDDNAMALALVWFRAQRYKLVGDPAIFWALQHPARKGGMACSLAYNRSEIDEVELYARLRADTDDVYAAGLLGAGIADAANSPQWELICHISTLQAVKALLASRGLQGDETHCHPQVAIAMSTPWLRFVDKLHAALGLPRVVEIKNVVESGSPEETAVIESNDFETFKLIGTERAELEKLTHTGSGLPDVVDVEVPS